MKSRAVLPSALWTQHYLIYFLFLNKPAGSPAGFRTIWAAVRCDHLQAADIAPLQ